MPAFARLVITGKQFGRQFPKVLAQVMGAHKLDRAGKVLIGEIPDPDRAVA